MFKMHTLASKQRPGRREGSNMENGLNARERKPDQQVYVSPSLIWRLPSLMLRYTPRQPNRRARCSRSEGRPHRPSQTAVLPPG